MRLENQIPKDDPSTPGEKPYDQMYPAGNEPFLDSDDSSEDNLPGDKPPPYDKGYYEGGLNNSPFSPINPYPDWQQQVPGVLN